MMASNRNGMSPWEYRATFVVLVVLAIVAIPVGFAAGKLGYTEMTWAIIGAVGAATAITVGVWLMRRYPNRFINPNAGERPWYFRAIVPTTTAVTAFGLGVLLYSTGIGMLSGPGIGVLIGYILILERFERVVDRWGANHWEVTR